MASIYYGETVMTGQRPGVQAAVIDNFIGYKRMAFDYGRR